MEARQNCAMVRCLLPHSVLRRASAWCKPFKPTLQITQLALCCKIFFRCAGQDCSTLRRTILFLGGDAPKKAAGETEKYKKHSSRRGGSGTEGAVAQFSMGRRCGNWQCTGRLWSSGFAAAPHSKPAGVALATPLVGDRVRLAPRPHRSLHRPLPRRLFASAPAAHAPAAARRFPSSCTRPRRPPPSTPLKDGLANARHSGETVISVKCYT